MMLLTKTLGNAFAILTNGGIIYIVNYSVWPVSLFMTSSSEIRNHVTVPQVFWNVGIFYMKMEKSAMRSFSRRLNLQAAITL